jgi:hypothetical protein
MRAYTLLAGAHEMNRHHPLVKGNVRILKDRSDSDAESLSASRTLPQSAPHLVFCAGLRFHLERVTQQPTVWTHGAIGPELRFNECDRAFFIAEILCQLREVHTMLSIDKPSVSINRGSVKGISPKKALDFFLALR